jgi:hypothetical protein
MRRTPRPCRTVIAQRFAVIARHHTTAGCSSARTSSSNGASAASVAATSPRYGLPAYCESNGAGGRYGASGSNTCTEASHGRSRWSGRSRRRSHPKNRDVTAAATATPSAALRAVMAEWLMARRLNMFDEPTLRGLTKCLAISHSAISPVSAATKRQRGAAHTVSPSTRPSCRTIRRAHGRCCRGRRRRS